jgi:hypothetical protein
MHGRRRLSCQHAQNADVSAVHPVKFGITGQPALTRPLTDLLPQATFAAVDRQPSLRPHAVIIGASILDHQPSARPERIDHDSHRGRAILQVDQDQPGVDQVERLRRRWVADHVVPTDLERAAGRGLGPRHVDVCGQHSTAGPHALRQAARHRDAAGTDPPSTAILHRAPGRRGDERSTGRTSRRAPRTVRQPPGDGCRADSGSPHQHGTVNVVPAACEGCPAAERPVRWGCPIRAIPALNRVTPRNRRAPSPRRAVRRH